MGKMIQRACRNCGKLYFTDEARLKQRRGLDCSLECSHQSRAKLRQKRVTKICPTCGKEFQVVRSQADKRTHCSRACRWPPVYSICPHCEKEFRHPPSKRGKYCSKACADASEGRKTQSRENAKRQWQDPVLRQRLMDGIKARSESEEWRSAAHFQRGPDHPRYKGNRREREGASRYKYKKWHKDVLQRHDYTCQSCGKRGGRLVAHHVKPWADTPELRYDVGNGLALCPPCHDKVHNRKAKPFSRECEHCGQVFKLKKYHQRFCSRDCFQEHRRNK